MVTLLYSFCFVEVLYLNINFMWEIKCLSVIAFVCLNNLLNNCKNSFFTNLTNLQEFEKSTSNLNLMLNLSKSYK